MYHVIAGYSPNKDFFPTPALPHRKGTYKNCILIGLNYGDHSWVLAARTIT